MKCFLAVWMAMLLAGCSIPYRSLVQPVLSMGADRAHLRHLRLRVETADTDEPAPGYTFTLDSPSKPLTLVSDENGYILLPIDDVYLEENPPLRMPWLKLRRLTLSYNFTASGSMKSGDAVTAIPLDDKARLTSDDLVVLYEDGLEERAQQVMTLMTSQRRLIQQELGLDAPAWAIVLIAEDPADSSIVVMPLPDIPMTWCYSVTELDSGYLAGTNMHEWTEHTVTNEFDLYDADRRNRFIGDGLAEYMQLVHTDTPPGVATLQELLAEGVTHVNLLERFRAVQMIGQPLNLDTLRRSFQEQGFPPGYPLSQAFWLQLCEGHGADLPRRFVERLRESKVRDTPAAIAILEDLTGRRGIQAELESFDVAKARDALARYCEQSRPAQTTP